MLDSMSFKDQTRLYQIFNFTEDRMPNFSNDRLVAVYEQICRVHDGISDFRAKLLAALPIASAGGIFLLISDGGISKALEPYLGPIEVFAVVATLGLLAHEMRGIQRCFYLQRCAQLLEGELLGEKAGIGAFTFTNMARKFTGAPLAAALIYPAAISARTFMGLEGKTMTHSSRVNISYAIGVALVFVIGVLVILFHLQAEAHLKRVVAGSEGNGECENS